MVNWRAGATGAASGAAAGSAAGPWGAVAGGVIGGAMGLFSNSNSAADAAREQYKYNLKLQKQAQQWNEHMYQHRYQWQVDDLEKAGINKLYGLGTAPSMTSSASSVNAPEYVNENKAKMENALGMLNFGADLSAKRASTKLIEQQTKTEYYNTQLKLLETTTQELNNIYKKKELNWYDKKMKIELENTKSNTLKNLNDIETSNLINSPLKRYENWVKLNPELAKLLERTDKTSVSASIFKNLLMSGGTGWRMGLNKL